MRNSTLYETDFYGWAQEQAGLLRSGHFSKADIHHIAEEIDSMGKSEKRELSSRLIVLLLHLLKWQYQPERQSTSWRNTIRTQRASLAKHMAENPSLKPHLTAEMAHAYDMARLEAETETGIEESDFPTTSPWTYEEAMEPTFWPHQETGHDGTRTQT